MLTFTEEQMVWADQRARVHFHRRVRDYVREKIPETVNTIPNTQLLAYIGKQDKIAAEYEITTELGVTRWVCLSLGLGQDFYQEPEIKDYFNSPGLPDAETRLAVLVDSLHAQKQNPDIKIESVLAEHGYPVMGG